MDPPIGWYDALLRWTEEFKKQENFIDRFLDWLPLWVTPNGITWLRTALFLPIYWCMQEHYDGWAVILFGISSTCDHLDGKLAYRRQQHTALGAFLDPLSDKIVNCGVLLTAVPRLPSAFGPPVTVMCLFAFGLTTVRLWRMWRAYRKTGSTERAPTAAKNVGKLKVICEITAIILLLLGLHLEVTVLVWTAGVLLIAAVLLAARSFWAQYEAAP